MRVLAEIFIYIATGKKESLSAYADRNGLVSTSKIMGF